MQQKSNHWSEKHSVQQLFTEFYTIVFNFYKHLMLRAIKTNLRGYLDLLFLKNTGLLTYVTTEIENLFLQWPANLYIQRSSFNVKILTFKGEILMIIFNQ